MNSLTKPISFKENNIMQKLYLDNYLFKKYGWLNNKKKNETEVKNNNFFEKKIYFKTLSHEKINNIPINIYINVLIKIKTENKMENLYIILSQHIYLYIIFLNRKI
jgi:hypothetical protein